MNKLAPLQHAIDLDAYDWLSQNAPYYIDAIQQCLADGSQPDVIKRYLLAEIGTDRQALAFCAEQAARHILRTENV